MNDLEKKMGIIKNAGYGLYDTTYPCLYFTVYIEENEASMQIMSGKQADEFIEAYGINDVSNLNGKPVWVYVNSDIMKNVEPCIID